jgi:type II secretory pathway pseudopilin PulG
VRFARKSVTSRQRGYILLTLMLFVAFLGIAALAILPTVAFQARRDREEEMIHRGVQYSRAVRRYYKKFGRYPTRIEDLENTNNQR